MSQSRALLEAAESIATILQQRFGTETLVIGAIALAAHHYVRFTEDIDLGINAEADSFREMASALAESGFDVTVSEPGVDDPLSGVIDVRGTFGLVQIINFGGTFPAAIRDALKDATLTISQDSELRLTPLPQLVALKVYAGGLKSKADVAELLARNPDADLAKIRAVCKQYRLHGIDEILENR